MFRQRIDADVNTSLLKFVRIESCAVSAAGLILFCEVGAAIQWNITFLPTDVVREDRFILYVWTMLGFATLFIVRGVTAVRAQADASFAIIEGPLLMSVALLAIVAVHGWRMAADAVSIDALHVQPDLPAIIVFLATPALFWPFAIAVAMAVGVAFWKVFRSSRSPTVAGNGT